MATSNDERNIFSEIQKKLFYMIPEKWEAIYLYASIVERPLKKPVGEMYFYYVPKGILKRKPVNVYQIPAMFNIDEESYNNLIQKLFLDIKKLRSIQKEYKDKMWTNLTISIHNAQFKIEYFYDDLGKNSEFTPYERHIIWRYKNLNDDADFQTKDEKKIIERYLKSELAESEKNNRDIYCEGIYMQQNHNIIDYERTLTVEAAIASQSDDSDKKSKKNKKEDNPSSELKANQILFAKVEKMKETQDNIEKRKSEDLDDDIILSSDLMKKKD